MNRELRHWRLEHTPGTPAWLWLDRADASTNTLSSEVMAELDTLLDRFADAPPSALVIASAKAGGFIAGADIEELRQLATPAAARVLVQRGWNLFNRLAETPYPTLALIRGHCMGGGLELALACRYRIAIDEPDTRFALPEVMLGIVPGWGGMARLPALIGPPAALDLMLTGRSIDAHRARSLGLVDEAVPARVMRNAATTLVTSGRAPRRASWLGRALNGPLKGIVAARARRQLAKRARPQHYPAPHALVEIWHHHDGNALTVPAVEPGSLEALMRSRTAQNLVRVFFLRERLKGFAKGSDFAPSRVHVVGAGTMGGDIAAWCALHGMTVTLQDQAIERIAPAVRRAAALYARKFRRDPARAAFTLDRLIPDPRGEGVARADVIIEAIFENLDAKRTLFADLERRARPDAVLATNTSSLPLEDIASALEDPARLVGIHFFNPVAKMPLVEIVHGRQTPAALTARAAAFAGRLDKLPLPVASAPGFLVNAVLGPYLLEAMRCVDEGIAAEVVDEALLEFGMPMGPIELADTVGLDVVLAAGAVLGGAEAVPKRLQSLVDAGHLGRKSGRGFYRWENDRAHKAGVTAIPDGLAARIIEPLLDAARACVEAGVVEDADLADAGVIFGTGFAPFTGGPLNYLAQREAQRGQQE